MKAIKSILFGLFLLGSLTSCNAQSQDNKTATGASGEKIEAYYFHYTRRCATCNAVEAESIAALKKFYPEQMKDNTITFTSINLDDESSNEVAEKLGVSSQALLIVKGDVKKDITSEGFMYARNNPEKLHEKIKSEVDKFLK